MAFPALDALREAYEVYPVVDAIGGTSEDAHRTGIERVVQAGAQPVTWVALAVELQRDWAREETVADVIEIVLTERLQKALPPRPSLIPPHASSSGNADPVLARVIDARLIDAHPDFHPRACIDAVSYLFASEPEDRR